MFRKFHITREKLRIYERRRIKDGTAECANRIALYNEKSNTSAFVERRVSSSVLPTDAVDTHNTLKYKSTANPNGVLTSCFAE